MGIMYLSLLFFIPLIVNSNGQTCGIETPHPERIVNGHNLPYPRKYPWFAALTLSENPRQLVCGGTLINERHIITAAHCYKPFFKSVEEGKRDLEHIFLAKLNVNNMCIKENEMKVYSTIKVHIHKSYYDDQPLYDIAILILEESVTNVPICLPKLKYDDSNRTNLTGTIVGLGKESSNAFRYPCYVKEAKIPIQKQSDCVNMLEKNKFDSRLDYIDSIFCAGETEGGTDTCQGDSGGPLQIYNNTTNTWTILGITSFGFGCAKSQTYGVYTDVSYYIDWINARIKYDEDDN